MNEEQQLREHRVEVAASHAFEALSDYIKAVVDRELCDAEPEPEPAHDPGADHITSVEQDNFEDGRAFFWAACSCGWTGEEYTVPEGLNPLRDLLAYDDQWCRAKADATAHREEEPARDEAVQDEPAQVVEGRVFRTDHPSVV